MIVEDVGSISMRKLRDAHLCPLLQPSPPSMELGNEDIYCGISISETQGVVKTLKLIQVGPVVLVLTQKVGIKSKEPL
jgi:hypothetical protein